MDKEKPPSVGFYEELASYYHLLFENWDESMQQQGNVIARLVSPPHHAGIVLDCACGIGTQSIALAQLGYSVEASDLSSAEIARAQREASRRHLSIAFRTDDMRLLTKAPLAHYGIVMAMDNSLPHLGSDEDLIVALHAMYERLKSGGMMILSMRDYEKILQEHPTWTLPQFFTDGKYRRIVHQVWDWIDSYRYRLHLYITVEHAEGWQCHHFTGQYRAIEVQAIVVLMKKVGFVEVTVLPPRDTGYYQPIILGKKAS